jgi:hypothetical protein
MLAYGEPELTEERSDDEALSWRILAESSSKYINFKII